MVFILDGNSEHGVHAWREVGLFSDKKNPICDCSRSNQMPAIVQITVIYDLPSYISSKGETISGILITATKT